MTTEPSRVFTTKPVLDGDAIVWAYHDEDGDWQFFGHSPVRVEDGRTALIEHLLARDPSLEPVLDMPAGFAAVRATADTPWIIDRHESLYAL